eukprot:m.271757 g.271757  ORF g.271757 m.271757 type:complete len:489 (-) comp11084_c0_seq67:84-1550(-)
MYVRLLCAFGQAEGGGGPLAQRHICSGSMGLTSLLLAALLCLCLGSSSTSALQTKQTLSSSSSTSEHPDYDHQRTTYRSRFPPLRMANAHLDIMPYFSPDHSVQTIVDFIDGAQHTLSVFTPGFSSWSNCTPYNTDCAGCTVPDMDREAFPVFPALLNALNRGVQVELITNNYNTPTCTGKIAPLDFLVLAGAKIYNYASTTFMHAKFLMRDNSSVSISSINWTKNSCTNDREAGVILSGTDIGKIVEFVTSVYRSDKEEGTLYKVNQTYSAADMAIIQSKAVRPVNVPPGPQDRAYITPKPAPISIVGDVAVSTSPDFSFDELESHLSKALKTLDVYIYQVTDERLCDFLIAFHRANRTLKLLVSKHIYGDEDYYEAQKCYARLYDAGITIRTAWYFNNYFYNHQKFWIIDGSMVGLSTGNWSPSDYPGGHEIFPPYPNPNWRDTNRDFTVTMKHPDIVSVFQTVLDRDYANGTDWHPRSRESVTLL